MKHKVKALFPVEKKGLFGKKKIIYEKRTIEVDGKTYRELKAKRKDRPYSVTEMMLYDEIFED